MVAVLKTAERKLRGFESYSLRKLKAALSGPLHNALTPACVANNGNKSLDSAHPDYYREKRRSP